MTDDWPPFPGTHVNLEPGPPGYRDRDLRVLLWPGETRYAEVICSGDAYVDVWNVRCLVCDAWTVIPPPPANAIDGRLLTRHAYVCSTCTAPVRRRRPVGADAPPRREPPLITVFGRAPLGALDAIHDALDRAAAEIVDRLILHPPHGAGGVVDPDLVITGVDRGSEGIVPIDDDGLFCRCGGSLPCRRGHD